MASDDLTRDAFLGGQLHLWQPRKGYRAGVDPMFLAASCPAKAGQSVLELGCGAGAAILALGRRVPGLALTGLERQAVYADLARRNAAENDLPLRLVQGDLAQMPADLRQESFDHVIMNPPYFRRDRGTGASDAGREGALGEETPQAVWLEVAAKRLAPKGYLTLIQRAERLGDMLGAMPANLGSIEVLPLAPRAGRAAQLILIRARKGGRADLKLHAQMVLHAGALHMHDGDDYTPEVSAILRNGKELPWPE